MFGGDTFSKRQNMSWSVVSTFCKPKKKQPFSKDQKQTKKPSNIIKRITLLKMTKNYCVVLLCLCVVAGIVQAGWLVFCYSYSAWLEQVEILE